MESEQRGGSCHPRVKALWSDAQLVLACSGLGHYCHPEGDGGVCRTHLWKPFGAFEHVTWVTFFSSCFRLIKNKHINERHFCCGFCTNILPTYMFLSWLSKFLGFRASLTCGPGLSCTSTPDTDAERDPQ